MKRTTRDGGSRFNWLQRCSFYTGSFVLVVTAFMVLRSLAALDSPGSGFDGPLVIDSPLAFDSIESGDWLVSGQSVTLRAEIVDKAGAENMWNQLITSPGIEKSVHGMAETDIETNSAVSFAPEILDFLDSFHRREVDAKRYWLVGEFSSLRMGILVQAGPSSPYFLFGIAMMPDGDDPGSSAYRVYTIRPAKIPDHAPANWLLPAEFLPNRIATRWSNSQQLNAEVHLLDRKQLGHLLYLLSESGWQSDSDLRKLGNRHTYVFRRQNELLCLIASYDSEAETYSVVTSVEAK